MNNEMTTDNMSNEEVIEVLKGLVFGSFDRTTRKERQALDFAIKALEERPQGDLISRSELKKCAIPCQIHNGALTDLCVPLYQIDNAPTVETSKVEYKAYNEGFKDGVEQGIKLSETPGEWIETKHRVNLLIGVLYSNQVISKSDLEYIEDSIKKLMKGKKAGEEE